METQSIIDTLRNRNDPDEAYVGYFFDDEMIMKANHSGLELYAAELLKAAMESRKPAENNKIQNYIPNNRFIHPESDDFIAFIELNVNKRSDLMIPEIENQSIENRLLSYIVWVVVGGIIILILIGLSTVIDWIFLLISPET